MATQTVQRILTIVDGLIAEGMQVAQTERVNRGSGEFRLVNPVHFVEVQAFAKWVGGCQNLMRVLGKLAEPWQQVFAVNDNSIKHAKQMLGTLEAIKSVVAAEGLVTVEDLVMAEAFADLLEQADYLLSENYALAAGVIGRAVLEEHLRKLCGHASLVPTKPKPTLNDWKQELQKASKLNKIEVTHVDAMATVGNEAAHNKPGLKGEDVERMLRDVREFLVRHPLS